MKKLLLVMITLLLISGCAYEKRGDRLVLTDWKLTYFPNGINGGSEVYYSEYPTLDQCENAGIEKIKEKLTEYPDADFFCGTNCILVKDGIEPRHCDNGVAATCSNAGCEYIEDPEIRYGFITID